MFSGWSGKTLNSQKFLYAFIQNWKFFCGDQGYQARDPPIMQLRPVGTLFFFNLFFFSITEILMGKLPIFLPHKI